MDNKIYEFDYFEDVSAKYARYLKTEILPKNKKLYDLYQKDSKFMPELNLKSFKDWFENGAIIWYIDDLYLYGINPKYNLMGEVDDMDLIGYEIPEMGISEKF